MGFEGFQDQLNGLEEGNFGENGSAVAGERTERERMRNSGKKVKYMPECDYRSTGNEGPVDRKQTESPASKSVDWSYTSSRPVAQKKSKIFSQTEPVDWGQGPVDR